MGRGEKPADIEKFLKLDDDKRERILNAAMKEFRYGYVKASTDVVVKEAGISKGLLFHYFGTKEQLYVFLVRQASELVQKDYFDMMNLGHKDILEGFWQLALLKKDITDKYPFLYAFINGTNTHMSDFPDLELTEPLMQKQFAVYQELYDRCDTSLFREDIDHKKAIDIIAWTVDSLIDDADAKAISAGDWNGEEYDRFLSSLKGYLDVFRTCFYKKGDGNGKQQPA